MEIKISIEELRKKKLFVATPMYGGMCAGMYTKSIGELNKLCTQYGIPMNMYFLFNESLITRARNYCVDVFMRSDATHLLFIDSDIGFNPQDVFILLHLTDHEKGMGVVTGPYPKKTVAWEKVQAASKAGLADDNPFELEKFMADYVFNPAEGISQFRIDEPVEVKEGGTGFMMIDKRVFLEYDKHYPELKYKPDHVRTEDFDGSREIMAYFDTIIDPESRRYLSEDYMFSHNVRRMGGKVWLCPWMQLQHIGTYTFTGSMAAMAAIQASPTASSGSSKKFYQKEASPTPLQVTESLEGMDLSGLNRKARRAADARRGKKKGK